MATKKYRKYALIEWRKKWQSDEWYFTSYKDKDSQEREVIKEDFRMVLNLPDRISAYVEESKIEWGKKQLLIERQKYLLDEQAVIVAGLAEVTKLLEKTI